MILELFLIGLVITLEPIPLTAMILLLAAEGGLLKGLGYVLGWMLTLVVIVAVTVVVTGGQPLRPQTAPSTAALSVKLGIGAVLVFIGYRRRGKPSSGSETEKKQPRWIAGSIMSTRWRPPAWRFFSSHGCWSRPVWRPSPRRNSPRLSSTSRSLPSVCCVRRATSSWRPTQPAPRQGQGLAGCALGVDQRPPRAGHRVLVAGAWSLSDGGEHLRTGERRVDERSATTRRAREAGRKERGAGSTGATGVVDSVGTRRCARCSLTRGPCSTCSGRS